MICFHHNDLDGRCAAHLVNKFAILKANEELKLIEMNHGYKTPFNKIKENETVYIVDFSLSIEDMDKLFTITKNIIWIDHHKTSLEKFEKYQHHIDGIRKIGISGCELTYMYLMNTHIRGVIPYYVQLIGHYDVFDFKEGDPAELFYYACMGYDNTANSSFWNTLTSNNIVDRMIKEGGIIKQYRKRFYADCIKAYGFETKFEGHTAIVLNAGHTSSMDFGDLKDKYDLLISTYFNGEKWFVSLYSQKIDVSEIAKKYGGGGHAGASGFSSTEYLFNKGGK